MPADKRDRVYIDCPHTDTGVHGKNIVLEEDSKHVVTLVLCSICAGLVRESVYSDVIDKVIRKGIHG